MTGHDDGSTPDEPFTVDNLKETDMTDTDMADTDITDTSATATGTSAGTDTSTTTTDAATNTADFLTADASGPRPRIRTGAIVWGALVSAVAALVLVLTTSPETNSAFGTWVGSLGVGGLVLAAVIALGAFIVLMAVLSLIRRAQRRRSAPTR